MGNERAISSRVAMPTAVGGVLAVQVLFELLGQCVVGGDRASPEGVAAGGGNVDRAQHRGHGWSEHAAGVDVPSDGAATDLVNTWMIGVGIGDAGKDQDGAEGFGEAEVLGCTQTLVTEKQHPMPKQ